MFGQLKLLRKVKMSGKIRLKTHDFESVHFIERFPKRLELEPSWVFATLQKTKQCQKCLRFLFIAFLTFIDRKGWGSFQASVLRLHMSLESRKVG